MEPPVGAGDVVAVSASGVGAGAGAPPGTTRESVDSTRRALASSRARSRSKSCAASICCCSMTRWSPAWSCSWRSRCSLIFRWTSANASGRLAATAGGAARGDLARGGGRLSSSGPPLSGSLRGVGGRRATTRRADPSSADMLQRRRVAASPRRHASTATSLSLSRYATPVASPRAHVPLPLVVRRAEAVDEVLAILGLDPGRAVLRAVGFALAAAVARL